MCPVFMKFGNQNKSNMLIINILIGIDYPNPKFKFANLVPKLKFSPIFIKSHSHNKSNMLIMNIILASV